MKKRINTNSAARAVIYARYSSANQRDCSIEQQVEKCRELAAREGVTVIEIYADRAISGKTDRRPNFQRMMKDASLRQFDVVLAWKSNRMGRNMLQAMMTAYEAIGFKRGRNVMVKLLQYLTDTFKRDKLFYYDMTQAETMLFDEE